MQSADRSNRTCPRFVKGRTNRREPDEKHWMDWRGHHGKTNGAEFAEGGVYTPYLCPEPGEGGGRNPRGGHISRHHWGLCPGTGRGDHHGGLSQGCGRGLFCPGKYPGPGRPGDLSHRHDHHQPCLGPADFPAGPAAGPAGFGCPGDRRGHRGPGRAPSPFWWAGRRRTTRPAGPCWRPWGPTSATRAPQAADSMPNWPTKS